MAGFDPYRKWLGIPPNEQPPNHYRLLGIGLFESDPEVIVSAAGRQISYVQGFRSGEHAEAAQFLDQRIGGGAGVPARSAAEGRI